MGMKKSTLFTAIVSLFLLSGHIFAQPNILGLGDFALFTATGAFEVTGNATVVDGDVGTNAGAYAAFPPGTLNGTAHLPGSTEAADAATDVMDLYTELDTWPGGCTVLGVGLGNGQVLTPGVYCIGAATTLNGNLTLDGNGLYIFQIDGAFATGLASSVTLINGAELCDVWWQVNGQFDLGFFSVFRGTVVVNGAINLFSGSTLLGRALSRAGAISVGNNVTANSSCNDEPDIVPPPLDDIPTMGQWGLIILGLLFTVFAVVVIRKRAYFTAS